MPVASASSRMRSSNTVLPTPRRPTISMLLAGFPRRARPKAIRTVSRSSSRPASSGGGEPAPGSKGICNSIHGLEIIVNLPNLQTIYKLPNLCQTARLSSRFLRRLACGTIFTVSPLKIRRLACRFFPQTSRFKNYIEFPRIYGRPISVKRPCAHDWNTRGRSWNGPSKPVTSGPSPPLTGPARRPAAQYTKNATLKQGIFQPASVQASTSQYK